MILAVDIGNSNICIGGLDGMKVLFTARMVTRPRCTGDEYTAELLHLPDGRGGNAVARAHPGSVCLVSARNDAELRDVDTREDLNQLRQLTNR